MDREALIALLLEHIATPRECERIEDVKASGGTVRSLKRDRGKTIDFVKLADAIIANYSRK
jgi:hypothetical protein